MQTKEQRLRSPEERDWKMCARHSSGISEVGSGKLYSGSVSGSWVGEEGGWIMGVCFLRVEEVKRVVKENEREWWRVNSGELAGMDGDWPIQSTRRRRWWWWWW